MEQVLEIPEEITFLRRLLRRSSRFGKQLGFNEPFLYKLVGTVCETMGDFYKELLCKLMKYIDACY